MVRFNVVPTGPGAYHRATLGDIVIAAGPGELATTLSVPNLPVRDSENIEAVQWGKLLVNFNNALNALSGLPIQQQLTDRNWRRLMADQMTEALAVLKAAQIPVRSTMPLSAWMTLHILRLPTPLFIRIAAQMLTIDHTARTSMAYDSAEGRPTEIESLQGEIIALGRKHRRPTPLCSRVAERTAEASAPGETQPNLTPAQIRP